MGASYGTATQDPGAKKFGLATVIKKKSMRKRRAAIGQAELGAGGSIAPLFLPVALRYPNACVKEGTAR